MMGLIHLVHILTSNESELGQERTIFGGKGERGIVYVVSGCKGIQGLHFC